MYIFKVVAFLFIGIATSFGQSDLDFLLDRRELPVSVAVRGAPTSSTLPLGRTYQRRIKRK